MWGVNCTAIFDALKISREKKYNIISSHIFGDSLKVKDLLTDFNQDSIDGKVKENMSLIMCCMFCDIIDNCIGCVM